MGTHVNAHIQYINCIATNTENSTPTGTDRANGLTLLHSLALASPVADIPNIWADGSPGMAFRKDRSGSFIFLTWLLWFLYLPVFSVLICVSGGEPLIT